MQIFYKMIQFSKGVFIAFVVTNVLPPSAVVAWSPSLNSAIHRARTTPSTIPSTDKLFAVNPYSSLESVILKRSDSGTAESVTSIVNQVDSAISSVFQPVQNVLHQIIETEKALNNMEHTFVSSLAQTLLNLINVLDDVTTSLSANVINRIPAETLGHIVKTSIETAKSAASDADNFLLSNPTVGPIIGMIQNKILALIPIVGTELAELPPSVGLLASAGITYAIVSTALSMGEGPPPSSPYPLGRYDPSAARAYFDERPLEVAARAVQIGVKSTSFGLALLTDKMNNEWEKNEDKRSLELAVLLTELGPTFIKIGQSLSIRTDLLSPAYVRGLTSLQDQVPPFSTEISRQIIEEELGRPVDDIFSEFTGPVAAASLGQVFRARLRDSGKEVAVKVQRPNIMNQIALDMHLLREFAPIAKRYGNLNSDLVGTVDAWGTGFVDELDYIAEAENAEFFSESILKTPLKGVVFAPPIIEDCTTSKVLTSEWIIGERLDKSSKEDVTILCSVAMNTYLTMMLETGVLHCDPHPGNILVTPEKKLCILDWGMVTRLNPDLQVTLIEHMAHLTSADYAEIPRDLLLLGFIPESKADLIGDSGIVEVLADIYGAWTKGGGAAAINVNEVVSNLQDLTREKGNLFQIPPYFAYIAKSFSVLEGIGLSNDPNYSIINECLPYVSKRLLTDRSERTGGALSTFIFGPTKNDFKNRIIDYDRVEQLISGFGDYTTSASGASLGLDKSRVELIDDLADQVIDLLVTEEETPLQSIFIEQVAKIVTSSSRSLWTTLRERSGTLPSGRSVLGTMVDPFGLFRTSPVVRMNALDQKTIESTRNLINLLGEQAGSKNNPAFQASNFSGAEIQQLASTLVRKVWTNRTGFLRTGNRLATKLLQLTAEKLDSGEREVYVLSSTPIAKESDGRIHSEDKPQKQRSERMLTAERILREAEVEEAIKIR